MEDDLSDLIRFIHMDHPSMPITLGGHSAGGGTALHLLLMPVCCFRLRFHRVPLSIKKGNQPGLSASVCRD
ncbi:alpha/beta hydrolase [Paenibacillus sp. SYP-B3998]|uniref:Alpha/beta hydrolase n=1 Tax=Paenibacillus sp. SYP-B3998 TaxID=2678564 RepID=A0A6G4A2F9_9BACL|nr:alpha/beta hydrolase [Paenibacillus sp. SYP-B3998]